MDSHRGVDGRGRSSGSGSGRGRGRGRGRTRGRGVSRGGRGGRGRGGGGMGRGGRPGMPRHVLARREALSSLAQETKAELPGILRQLPGIQATRSDQASLDSMSALPASECPGFDDTKVRVLNEDSFDAAIILSEFLAATRNDDTSNSDQEQPPRVMVLNLASDSRPGGGWLNGSVAQEEALCYRSSLYLSLHQTYYPLGPRTGIYTPDVVIMRSSMASGHRLLLPSPSSTTGSQPTNVHDEDEEKEETAQTVPKSLTTTTASNTAALSYPTASCLPLVSVFSVAAIRRPASRSVFEGLGPTARARLSSFKDPADRDLTKDKMRLTLRASILCPSTSSSTATNTTIRKEKPHNALVLGALGCGAYHNPPEDVAKCWSEVLDEQEFKGGWWREVWFAVYDRKNEGNFELFERILGGKSIGRHRW